MEHRLIRYCAFNPVSFIVLIGIHGSFLRARCGNLGAVTDRFATPSTKQVWKAIRPLDFKFLPNVASVEIENKESPSAVGAVRKVTYKDSADGKTVTMQRIKLLELSDVNYTVTYDLIESTPAVKVMSAIYSLKLSRVSMDNTTYVEWSCDFSSDASQEVIQDAKYKKLEGFAALGAFVAKQARFAASDRRSEGTQ